MAEIHLESSFVHLLQICQKGCAMPPQDVGCPEICVNKALAMQQLCCVKEGADSGTQIRQRPAAAEQDSSVRALECVMGAANHMYA